MKLQASATRARRAPRMRTASFTTAETQRPDSTLRTQKPSKSTFLATGAITIPARDTAHSRCGPRPGRVPSRAKRKGVRGTSPGTIDRLRVQAPGGCGARGPARTNAPALPISGLRRRRSSYGARRRKTTENAGITAGATTPGPDPDPSSHEGASATRSLHCRGSEWTRRTEGALPSHAPSASSSSA